MTAAFSKPIIFLEYHRNGVERAVDNFEVNALHSLHTRPTKFSASEKSKERHGRMIAEKCQRGEDLH